VQHFDGDGEELRREEFEVLSTTTTAQSLFGTDLRFDLTVQSLEPILPENRAVFKARIENQFPEDAKLLSIKVEKNGKEIESHPLNQNIKNSYLFTTDFINLDGLNAQKNTIIIRAVLEYQGERQNQFFEYQYLSLTICERDTDCEDPTQQCDLGNQARFSSSSKERYCAFTCINHEQCATGQVCIKGFCGY